MRTQRCFARVTALAACLVAVFGIRVGAGQTDGQADAPDGLVHYALTLSGRQISVAHAPSLRARTQGLAALLAWSTGAATALHVGHLEGHRGLKIGGLGPDPGETSAAAPDHELWLTRTAAGWALDARPAETDEAVPADTAEAPEPALIPLKYLPRDQSADTLTATLVPKSEDTGELVLMWGRHSWTADFEFVDLPPRPRPARTSNVGPASSLTTDSDTSARARAARLGTRNETALVTPAGAQVQVLFQKELGTDTADYAGIDSTDDGDVVETPGAAVIRLRTEVPLRFGDTLVPTGNLSPEFPGAYGLWLKKAGSEWRLIFNNEPDSWGTQYDPAFDAAEIDVVHIQGGPRAQQPDEQPLAAFLAPRADGQVGLVVRWGAHVWTTDFRLVE